MSEEVDDYEVRQLSRDTYRWGGGGGGGVPPLSKVYSLKLNHNTALSH